MTLNIKHELLKKMDILNGYLKGDKWSKLVKDTNIQLYCKLNH